jgi:hypothetical protein
MHFSRLAFLVAAAAVVVGCGSSSSKTSTTTTAASAPVAPTTPTPAGGIGQLTAVGSQLKIGQTAVIAFKDLSHPATKGTIAVTPVSLEKGSAATDLKGIRLDPSQQGSTPYFVRVRFTNIGTGDLSGTFPNASLRGVDDRRQDQSSVTFIGDFPRCSETKAPAGFTHGKAFTSCSTFLIPRGGSLTGAKWSLYDPKVPDKQDINWTP